MDKGVVKWFNNAKGYGFILAEGSTEDIFAHYSTIDMNGYRTLRTGQPVLFEATAGAKGLHATAIQLIEGESIDTDNDYSNNHIHSQGNSMSGNESFSTIN
ncbi:MAG: cold shock domain-containing protein [Pseudomonadales bacterium]|nr:cold shock domain-containing protein [Pseudomonadales bacterium]